MATRSSGKPKQKKSGGRGKRRDTPAGSTASTGDGPGIGHNIAKIREEARAFFKRIDALNDAKELQVKDYNDDIDGVVEETVAALGKPKKIIKAVYTEHRREQKRQKWEAELDMMEKASYEELRDSFGASPPFGAFAGEKVKEFEAIDESLTGGAGAG
jgi:hypothetical protein